MNNFLNIPLKKINGVLKFSTPHFVFLVLNSTLLSTKITILIHFIV